MFCKYVKGREYVTKATPPQKKHPQSVNIGMRTFLSNNDQDTTCSNVIVNDQNLDFFILFLK